MKIVAIKAGFLGIVTVFVYIILFFITYMILYLAKSPDFLF